MRKRETEKEKEKQGDIEGGRKRARAHAREGGRAVGCVCVGEVGVDIRRKLENSPKGAT